MLPVVGPPEERARGTTSCVDSAFVLFSPPHGIAWGSEKQRGRRQFGSALKWKLGCIIHVVQVFVCLLIDHCNLGGHWIAMSYRYRYSIYGLVNVSNVSLVVTVGNTTHLIILQMKSAIKVKRRRLHKFLEKQWQVFECPDIDRANVSLI
jgi:hypothetical protein